MSFLLNANLSYKIFLGGTITVSLLATGYLILRKDPSSKKQDIFKSRQGLLYRNDVKMLYSTLSFFYLVGFRSMQVDSFFLLDTVMKLEPPQIVALPISKEEYEEKHRKAKAHPRFRYAMDNLKFDLAMKNAEAVANTKDFNLKNLEYLLLIDRCNALKKCKVVYALRESSFYKSLDAAYERLPADKRENAITGNSAKIEDYTQALIKEMKPEMKFSLTPNNPFKTIVGIVEPEILAGVANKWKEKFKQNYNHVVMEDEDSLLRNEEKKNLQQEKASKAAICDKQETGKAVVNEKKKEAVKSVLNQNMKVTMIKHTEP